MKRRTFLAASTAALAAPLAAPSIGRTQGTRLLRFIPQADLTVLDPIWTTAYVTRNHGFMVYDTLYGQDSSYKASPQMVAGHVVESDGRLWRLTLRDGLKFHDGERCWRATASPRSSVGAGVMRLARRCSPRRTSCRRRTTGRFSSG